MNRERICGLKEEIDYWAKNLRAAYMHGTLGNIAPITRNLKECVNKYANELREEGNKELIDLVFRAYIKPHLSGVPEDKIQKTREALS